MLSLVIVVILLLFGVGGLAYLSASLAVWTVAGFAWLFLVGKFASGPLAGLLMVLAWLGWLALAAMNLPDLRRRLLTRPLLALYRRLLPSVSPTEQAALDAGTVWWDGELFSGRPNWSRLLSTPNPGLSREERAFLDGPVEELCGMLDDWDINFQRADLPPEVWEFIRSKGFLSLIIPKAYGGLEFSARAQSEIVMKISTRCGPAAVTVMVPNSLGPAELLLHYGTQEQRDHYLPRLARGEELPCFALTSPVAGSDAAAIPDLGVVCRGQWQGEDVLGIRVTWEKRYITLGPVATLLGLAFQLHDPDGLLGGAPDVGITLALIPTDHPGVHIGRRHYPARQAFQNGPNSGTDVFIPMNWVIGGQGGCGQGWRMLMNCLAAGRAISLPALSTAGLKFCARYAGAYARIRRQFGIPIGRFEGVEEPLARIAADCYLIDAARAVTAAALDAGEEPAVLSAILKYQATERMRRAVNDAMDIHGGRAICDGPGNYLMSTYTAIPIAITVEGANILTRSLIVFGQGAVRCHPWLLREIAAVGNADETVALEAFDTALRGHLAYSLGNLARAFVQNLTGGFVGSDPSIGEVNYWYAQMERWCSAFVAVADVALMLLGGALKRREKLSGRFADVFSGLYLLSCVLKQFEDRGRPPAELPLLEYVMRRELYRIQATLYEITLNLPNAWAGRMLRWLVFPLGRRLRPPGDDAGQAVAQLLLEPGIVRDTLTAGCYISDDPQDPTGRIEHAFGLAVAIEPIEQRLRDAQRNGVLADRSDHAAAEQAGVIDAAERAALDAAHAAIRRAIDVDDFPPDAFKRA